MKWGRLCCLCLLIGCLLACHSGSNHSEETGEENDLPQIIDRGELVVLTVNGSTSYFNYRGEPMGFQYELAQQFAASLGVKLKLKVVKNTEELVRQLLNGEGDLIAYNLPVTNALKDSVIYCGEANITHQVVVQRKGKDALKNVTQLVGKEVYVQPGKYQERLINLDKELGGGIQIHTIAADSISAEELISWVAEGKIDYTVSTDELAKINRTYYPNLNIGLAISFDQRASWAVRKSSPLLAQAADKWHKENINSPEFKASAKEIGWDWRLLASLAYVESNFDPKAVSWAGAKGLMQLMPATARSFGVPAGKEQDPEESVKAAVKYIAALQQSFGKVKDKDEQVKFVLAAYNAGVGHVTDAMALSEKYGRSSTVWEHHVAHYMLLKSNEEFYQDPVCKNGYFRGTETYNFVKRVIALADDYRKKIK